MKKYKIKVLKDTPFDKAGTELSISAFRTKYSYICTRDVSDDDLVSYLLNEKEFYGKYYSENATGGWFEPVEVNFKIGDWVWHEGFKRAFRVMPYGEHGKKWRPNYTSVNAVNEYKNIYKRKATQEEIEYYDLISYCDGDVLIGNYKCYYHMNTWKELKGVRENVAAYIEGSSRLIHINCVSIDSGIDSGLYSCQLNGLKVGCKIISNLDIIKIAEQLKII